VGKLETSVGSVTKDQGFHKDTICQGQDGNLTSENGPAGINMRYHRTGN